MAKSKGNSFERDINSLRKKIDEISNVVCKLADQVNVNNNRINSRLNSMAMQIPQPIEGGTVVEEWNPFKDKKFRKLVAKYVRKEVRRYLKNLEKELKKEEEKERREAEEINAKAHHLCPPFPPILGISCLNGEIRPVSVDDLPDDLKEFLSSVLRYHPEKPDDEKKDADSEDKPTGAEDAEDSKNDDANDVDVDEEDDDEDEKKVDEKKPDDLMNDQINSGDDKSPDADQAD